jgi:hypothetical protein
MGLGRRLVRLFQLLVVVVVVVLVRTVEMVEAAAAAVGVLGRALVGPVCLVRVLRVARELRVAVLVVPVGAHRGLASQARVRTPRGKVAMVCSRVSRGRGLGMPVVAVVGRTVALELGRLVTVVAGLAAVKLGLLVVMAQTVLAVVAVAEELAQVWVAMAVTVW